jgi:hypothetical protein
MIYYAVNHKITAGRYFKSNEVAKSFSALMHDMWNGTHRFVNPERFLVLNL